MGASVERTAIVVATLLVLSCGGGGGGGTDPQPVPSPAPAPPVSPTFHSEGLDNLAIIEIREHSGRLFAATHNGLYGKDKGTDVWMPLGLDGHRVESIAVFDDLHWVASVFDPILNGQLNPALKETVNGGANWLDLATDYGAGSSSPEPVFRFHYDRPTGRLFATGTDLLAQSDDRGQTWQLLEGQFDSATSPMSALALNAATQQIWFGGQNAIEEMVLRRYDIASGSSDSYLRLLPSPSVAKHILFDPTNPVRIIVSGEGGLLHSLDNGISWEAPLGDVNHRFYFATALDPANPALMYTAGWDKNFDSPQPLILQVSRDRGRNFEQHQFDDPTLFGGVWSLHATTEEGQTVLYLGLFRGGIYKVTF